mmetsp:Transcript_30324/g.56842  ORF Transcript_30324/g.56842 Transcript_30324/m.56842 type:complete len:99 (+) Transcript_30324:13-309(+)
MCPQGSSAMALCGWNSSKQQGQVFWPGGATGTERERVPSEVHSVLASSLLTSTLEKDISIAECSSPNVHDAQIQVSSRGEVTLVAVGMGTSKRPVLCT